MMTGPVFEVDTKATCLLCLNPNCPPIVEGRLEEGDELNFDKLNATKHGFRVLLRFLKVDFTKLSHFSTASSFHRLFAKSSQVNFSVSLCNECSSVTNDVFELFQTFENVRIRLDLCVKQLHEFIETGRKDEERLRKYRERMNAGSFGDLGLVQSNIAEDLRSEVQKKCSLKLERSLPRVMVTNCQNSGASVVDVEHRSKTKPQLASEIRRKRRLKANNSLHAPKIRFAGKAKKTGGKWKCLECWKELATVDSFNTHYRRFHLHSENSGQHQPRKCFECDKICKRRNLLERHRMINHPMNFFGRRIPPAISGSQLESTLAHFVGKVQASEWASLLNGDRAENCACPFCKKGMHYTKTSELRYHFLQRHFRDVIKHAGKQIETTSGENERNLEEETPPSLRKSGPTLTNCEHCGRTFNLNFHLRRHLISDHSYKFFKHRLPEEVSRESLEKGLASMMKKLELTPGLGSSFKCSVCGKGCRNRWTMRMHLLLAHFKQVVGNSGTMTSNSAALITKSESEPVVAFEVDPGLKSELKLEADEDQNILVKVENMDEDEEEEMTITEPFVLKVEPDTVDVEMETEMETEAQTKSKKCEKLKKNACSNCEKVFANSERRKAHYRRVHLRIKSNSKREAPGKCELCGKIYSQQQYLFKHKLQLHPIEVLKDKLPSGVTKEQLNEAIGSILEDMTQLSIEDEGKTKNIFECPFCDTKKTEKVNLKIHLLQYHLEKVIHKIGEQRSQSKPKLRPSLSQATPAPGRQKCEHCEKYIPFKHGNHRKHLMLEHALILYEDRLPQGISEWDFDEAVSRVQAAMKVLPKNRNDPRHFVECTLCSRKMRKHPREARFHVLWSHLDNVLREAEMIHGGEPLSPEHILPD